MFTEGTQTHGRLSSKSRGIVCKAIVSRHNLFAPDKLPSKEDFHTLAAQIVALFPEEVQHLYYSPYKKESEFQKKANAGGLLYNKFATN